MPIKRIGNEKIADLLKKSRNPAARAAVPGGGREKEGESPDREADEDAPRTKPPLKVEGIPSYLPSALADECETQLKQAVEEFLERTGLEQVSLSVGTGKPADRVPEPFGVGSSPASSRGAKKERSRRGRDDEVTVEERAQQYESRQPLFDFDFLVVPEGVEDTLLAAVDLLKVEEQVFGDWNLRSIEPFPRSALNFFGPPGTGKTLAAHAVASYLEKPILPASYAQIESKYVGDSSKNIEAVFHAAERDGAVLFIDEADSLLSRRLTEVSQGAEQAINSMRSQLLICLERYRGVAIFSTNLVQNYDFAFQTRMRYVHFPMPDEPGRKEIWRRHLPRQLPLAEDVSLDALAAIPDLCGRDIKNAVIDAALRAARQRSETITQSDLEAAVERVKQARV